MLVFAFTSQVPIYPKSIANLVCTHFHVVHIDQILEYQICGFNFKDISSFAHEFIRRRKTNVLKCKSEYIFLWPNLDCM